MITAVHGILARPTSGGGYTNEYSLQFDGVDEHVKGSTTLVS
jgi:hypothetical protein